MFKSAFALCFRGGKKSRKSVASSRGAERNRFDGVKEVGSLDNSSVNSAVHVSHPNGDGFFVVSIRNGRRIVDAVHTRVSVVGGNPKAV